MKTTLFASFVFGCIALLIAACVYPVASYVCTACALALAVHLLYGLILACIPMVTAGRIIGWSWTGISTGITCGLLITHAVTADPLWLLVASCVGLFSAFLLVVLAVGFRPFVAGESK